MKKSSNTYDVIIIGAGMSGLVCGCFLAKAGLKVLIAEQHLKPGGYCTSFKRKGFIFDAGAHIFGGYRHGPLGKIFRELKIEKRVKIYRYDPSDTIITPEYKVSFWADLDRTINDFQTAFPKENVNINNFFHFIFNPEPNYFFRIRSWTFKNLLDKYFNNEKLKTILSYPLLANSGGFPPSQISAFFGVKIFKEFHLDGGYYPKGGMQTLPDALATIFKESGGELLLACSVKKIKVKDSRIKGIVTEKGDHILSKYVISNCDAKLTFLKLLGKSVVNKKFINKINNMIPSLSMFVVYLGLDKCFNELPTPGTNMWYLLHHDFNNLYSSWKRDNFKKIGGFMIHKSPNQNSLLAFKGAPFKNKDYWINNKNKLLESFIKIVEMHSIPELSKHIIYKNTATPYTFYKYTLNYKGAVCGWAGTPSQFADPEFRKSPFIDNLYLTGHWTTHGLGIPGVVYLGYDTAKMILRKENVFYG